MTLLYGVMQEDLEEDQYLEQKRVNLIQAAATVLNKCNLINCSLSDEFKYIPFREEEKLELSKLLERVPIPVKEGIWEPTSKINVLKAFDLCKMSVPVDLIKRIEQKEFLWERYFDLNRQEIGELLGDVISRRWKQRKNVQTVGLFIADELHLIGGDVGPTHELNFDIENAEDLHAGSPVKVKVALEREGDDDDDDDDDDDALGPVIVPSRIRRRRVEDYAAIKLDFVAPKAGEYEFKSFSVLEGEEESDEESREDEWK
ncbi:hypothetical protein BC936DRAFT_147048, partial [Jimgerdemannia flammicorona]